MMKVVITNDAELLTLPSSLVPAVIRFLELRRSGYYLHPRVALDEAIKLVDRHARWYSEVEHKVALYRKPLKVRKGEKNIVYGYVKAVVDRYDTYFIDDEDDAVMVVQSLTRLVIPASAALRIVSGARGRLKYLKPVLRFYRPIAITTITVYAQERTVNLSKKYASILRAVYRTDNVETSISGFLIPLVWYVLAV